MEIGTQNVVPVEFHVYDRDVLVKSNRGRVRGSGGKRGEITELSADSLRRLAFVAANMPVAFPTMITLTYPDQWETNGAIVKANFRAMLQWLRRRIRPLSYFWFLEFQRRGAPHFHLFIQGWIKPKVLSRAWYRIVESGDVNHLRAGTRIERVRKKGGAARYAVKYAMKAYQKTVPGEYRNVGRFWGHSADVKPRRVGVATVNTEDQIRQLLAGWGWSERAIEKGYSVLFGAAGHVAGNAAKMAADGRLQAIAGD